jgi:hypothetical protein
MAGYDALARLEPISRPLLAEVDRALATLGAPAAHPVWGALRRVGATPADAVRAIADWDPAALREAARALQAQARSYGQTAVAPSASWRGPAAATYAAHAAALAGHLSVEPDSMAAKLLAMAGYADAVAGWFERTRAQLTGALADVMTSAQAVAIRASADGSVASSVSAAADIATHLLDVIAEALATGECLPDDWRAKLERVDFRSAAAAEAAPRSIDVHH